MRSLLFNILYWLVSIIFVLSLAPLSLIPGRKLVRAAIVFYARTMRFLMQYVAGIKRGKA